MLKCFPYSAWIGICCIWEIPAKYKTAFKGVLWFQNTLSEYSKLLQKRNFFSFFSIVFMYNYSGISKSSPGFLEELYNNRESQAPVLANWFKSLGGGSNPVRDLNQPLDNSSVHWSLKKLQKKLGKCWNLDFVDCGNLSEVDLEWSCLWKLPGLYFHSDLMTFMDQFVVCRMWKQ